jgi:hypothetical protein
MLMNSDNYEILTRYYEWPSSANGQWSNEVGADNVFASEAEAWLAVAELKTLGNDWAEADYTVATIAAQFEGGAE